MNHHPTSPEEKEHRNEREFTGSGLVLGLLIFTLISAAAFYHFFHP